MGHGFLTVAAVLVGRYALSRLAFFPEPAAVFGTGVGYGVGVGFYLRREILDALRYWRTWRDGETRLLAMLHGFGDGVVDLLFPVVMGGLAAMIVA